MHCWTIRSSNFREALHRMIVQELTNKQINVIDLLVRSITNMRGRIPLLLVYAWQCMAYTCTYNSSQFCVSHWYDKCFFCRAIETSSFQRGLYRAKSYIYLQTNRLMQLTSFRGYGWISSMFMLTWHYEFHLRTTIWF